MNKIYVLVDRQGPRRLSLSAGQAHDAPAALTLLDRRIISLAYKVSTAKPSAI